MQPSRYLYGGGYAGTLDVGNANSLITVISTIPRHKSFPTAWIVFAARPNDRLGLCSSECWNLSRMNNLLFGERSTRNGVIRGAMAVSLNKLTRDNVRS